MAQRTLLANRRQDQRVHFAQLVLANKDYLFAPLSRVTHEHKRARWEQINAQLHALDLPLYQDKTEGELRAQFADMKRRVLEKVRVNGEWNGKAAKFTQVDLLVLETIGLNVFGEMRQQLKQPQFVGGIKRAKSEQASNVGTGQHQIKCPKSERISSNGLVVNYNEQEDEEEDGIGNVDNNGADDADYNPNTLMNAFVPQQQHPMMGTTTTNVAENRNNNNHSNNNIADNTSMEEQQFVSHHSPMELSLMGHQQHQAMASATTAGTSSSIHNFLSAQSGAAYPTRAQRQQRNHRSNNKKNSGGKAVANAAAEEDNECGDGIEDGIIDVVSDPSTYEVKLKEAKLRYYHVQTQLARKQMALADAQTKESKARHRLLQLDFNARMQRIMSEQDD